MTMTLKTELINKVKEILPYGSTKQIHNRLVEKNIQLSYQYVWRCLNTNYTDENFDVMHEAALLCEEICQHREEQRKRIKILHRRKYKALKAH